ncbi:MAG: hypothetical protein EPO12_21215 [Aquabacterium sp.]|jgi:hypothetical protein|nr:MAG: hypothetical protein EPO12_21215 [Aquabacterium sp.]
MTARRTVQLTWTRAAAPLAAAAALACGVQDAAADNWPVYVTGTERVTHDSNLFRRDKDPESDTQSSTEVTVGLDKSYGRQTYQASLTGSVNRFANNDQLNNNGFQALGNFATTIGKDISLTAGIGRSRALASFDNGTERSTAKNIRDSSNYAVNARYGLYGKISVGAAASHFEQDYTATSGIYPEQKSSSYGVDVRYSPHDLLSFGVGLRHSPGSTSYGESNGNSELDYDTRTNNLDFSTSWRVTGLSALSARLSYTKQSRDSRAPDSILLDNGYKGWTGSLDWRYAPRGRVTYTLRASRDTSNNSSLYDDHAYLEEVIGAGKARESNEFGDSRINTAIGAGVDWDATAKIRIGADASLTYLKTQRTTKVNYIDIRTQRPGVYYAPGEEQTGRLGSVGLNATYSAQRWLSLSCGLSYAKRSADLFTEAYKNTSVSCSASATLNAQN